MHYLQSELYERIRTDPTIFEFLQNGSLDGVWYWDVSDPEHEWYSDRFAKVLGYEPGEIPPQSSWWQEHIHPDDLELAFDNFHRHCADESHPYDQIVRYRHKNGSTVWIRCRGLVIRDEAGAPARMLGAHTDVTALKEAEQEAQKLAAALSAQADVLERSNRELRSFARVLAHDLKEPIRNVFTYLGLVEMKYELPEGASELMAQAQGAAERMALMLDDILQIALLEAEDLLLNDVELETVVAKARQNLEPNEARYEIGPLPTIQGAEGQLVRVFQNLFGNAIKYAKPDSTPVVRVTGEQVGTKTVVEVSDSGRGFEAQFSEQVFELFSQLDPSQSSGSGIGLTVVRKIVELHGGTVTASGKPGVGATVRICFNCEGSGVSPLPTPG